jgi:hypothetical protein
MAGRWSGPDDESKGVGCEKDRVAEQAVGSLLSEEESPVRVWTAAASVLRACRNYKP